MPSNYTHQPDANTQIERGGILSTISFNPIDTLKAQLTPAGILGNAVYHAMSGGNVFMGLPYVFAPAMLFRGGLVNVFKSFKWSSTAAEAGTALLGGGVSFGGSGMLQSVLKDKYSSSVWRTVRKATAYGRKNGLTAQNVVMNLAKDGKLKALVGKTPKGFSVALQKSVASNLFTTRVFGLLTPIAIGAVAGQLTANVLSMGYKAASAATEFAMAKSEQIRGLEFGGTLGAGYRTQAAATERQRALQMLQRTHIAGRRGLGREAINYAALV